jgi:pimeloyl-ACP methyl ester carboxylesterase
VRRVVLSVTSAGVDMTGAADWRETYRRINPAAAPWITDPVPVLGEHLSAVAQPTLLLWEDADPISPLAVGERLLSLLPNAALHVSPGADHAHVVSRAAELVPLVAGHLG